MSLTINPMRVKLTQTAGRPQNPQPTPDGQTVVFSASLDEPGTRELFSVSVQSREQVQLTDRRVNLSYQAALSPSGDEIAYVVEKDRSSDLQVMKIDGSGNRNLTDNNKGFWNPTWSPDGKSIVTVSRDTEFENLELLRVDADGTEKNLVTDLRYNLQNPIFSPGGEHIVFGLSPGIGAMILCSVRADGSEFKSYAEDLTLSGKPTISKDGTIAFCASGKGGRVGLYTTKLDSDAPAQQIHNAKLAGSPTFSPDGSKLAFVEMDDDFNFKLRQLSVNGENLETLSPAGTDNSDPVYTADGRHIIYVSGTFSDAEVYRQSLVGEAEVA